MAKETRASGRRIDLAVAAVMALSRARWYATEGSKADDKPKVKFFSFD
jgi:phage terminase large subunit-like protein